MNVIDGTKFLLRRALPRFHVDERFLLRHFSRHSVLQTYHSKLEKLSGGRHHANSNYNCCDVRSCRRNRSRQRGSSRSLGVRLLSSSVLPSSLRLLPIPPTFLRLLPLSSLPSFLAPLAPLVLALAGGTNSKAASVVPTASGFAFVPIVPSWHVGVGTDDAGKVLGLTGRR